MDTEAELKAGIEKHLHELRAQRDVLSSRIEDVERALVLIAGAPLPPAPKLLGPAPKRPTRAGRAPVAPVAPPNVADASASAVLASLKKLGKDDADGWVNNGALCKGLGVLRFVTLRVLQDLQEAGQVEHNGRPKRSSRWRITPGAKPAKPAKPAAPPGTTTVYGRPITQRAKLLTLLRKLASKGKGMTRQDVERKLGLTPVSQRSLVHALRAKGLVRVEGVPGSPGSQRVFAVDEPADESAATAAAEDPAEDPAEESAQEPAPAEPEPPEAHDDEPEEPEVETPAPPPRKPPPMPKNPPPIVVPRAAAPPMSAEGPIVVPVERRTIKIPAIASPDDKFYCKPIDLALVAKTCLKQQEIATAIIPAGTGPMFEQAKTLKGKFAPTCANCKDGRQVASRLRS